jgi:hypothetical protein
VSFSTCVSCQICGFGLLRGQTECFLIVEKFQYIVGWEDECSIYRFEDFGLFEACNGRLECIECSHRKSLGI